MKPACLALADCAVLLVSLPLIACLLVSMLGLALLGTLLRWMEEQSHA